jgi:hypothetical protein
MCISWLHRTTEICLVPCKVFHLISNPNYSSVGDITETRQWVDPSVSVCWKSHNRITADTENGLAFPSTTSCLLELVLCDVGKCLWFNIDSSLSNSLFLIACRLWALSEQALLWEIATKISRMVWGVEIRMATTYNNGGTKLLWQLCSCYLRCAHSLHNTKTSNIVRFLQHRNELRQSILETFATNCVLCISVQ